MKISIYGIGNFGYAFLNHLDHNNDGSYQLTAYDYKPERIKHLSEHRSHPILHPDVKLSENVTFTDSLEELIADVDVILLAIPSPSTREAAQNIRKFATKRLLIVNTAKSLDYSTGRRLSEVAAEELSGVDHDYALVAGGTIAGDLFDHEPLGADMACENPESLDTLHKLFDSRNLYVYPTTDLVGVEYAAAFKNVISILAGIIHGMGLSYGAETHVISRLASGIAQVCVDKFGAHPETFSMGSQSWGNDMWMSCTGNTRNREYGILIGKGMDPDEALRDMLSRNRLAEGHNTLQVISSIEEMRQLPLLSLLHEVAIEKSASLDDLKSYLARHQS